MLAKNIMRYRNKEKAQFQKLLNELNKMNDRELELFMRKSGVSILEDVRELEREVLASMIVSEISTGDGYLTMNKINSALKEVKKAKFRNKL